MISTIVIGLLAGIAAKLIMPGPNDPKGLVMTALLGVVGAFLATYAGQAIGWYSAGEGAGFIASVVGAIVVLFGYSKIAKPTA